MALSRRSLSSTPNTLAGNSRTEKEPLTRDMVPITVVEWNKPKKANIGAKYLEQRIKDTLWTKESQRCRIKETRKNSWSKEAKN